MKKACWRIKDLIDLEYFLRSDEREGDESARKSQAKRDRSIYLKHIQPLEDKGETLPPGGAVRAWLEQRRNTEKSKTGPKTVLPGEAFEEVYRLLGYGSLIMGLMIGSGLAFSVLSYRGTEPLNVSVYLGVFILTQVFLLLLLMGMSLIRRWRRSPLRSSVIFILLSGLMGALIAKIKRRALKTLPGSKRDSLEAVVGLIKGKRQIYGSLFYWPVFVVAQVFGIGFNLGVLSATLLKVLGADMAFGWQSTVQFSAGAVFKLVQAVALPWSWFVPPEIAHPSMSQIEGSHMVLKDGIYHLATKDLVSWWPFLCFAVLCYGLLPRLILLIAGLAAQSRALGRIDFGHSACERLLHRLRSPLISTEGLPVGAEPSRMNQMQVPEAATSDDEEIRPDTGLIALIPEEILESCPDEELEKVISRTLGHPIRRMFRLGEEEEVDQGVLDELSSMKKENAHCSVLLFQEAWQPPIKENLLFIKALRKVLGKSSNIRVGLIGRPRPNRSFKQVNEEDWKAWHQKLKTLGDPYLGLERLVVNDGERGP